MYKKFVAILVCSLFLTTSIGCGQTKYIGTVEYDTYGLLNSNDKKNDAIEYKVIWGNVIWGCILVETLVAPVYFFGFSLFEPVGPKLAGEVKGQVRR